MRVVKAVQRSPPSLTDTRPLTAPKTYSLAKPGLFSASPLNSLQKATNRREENDVQAHLKEFAARYPNHHSFKELSRLTRTDEHRLSSDYTRTLFAASDRSRRPRSSTGETPSTAECHVTRTVSNETNIFDDQSVRQAVSFSSPLFHHRFHFSQDELRNRLKKRLDELKENQRVINEEIDENRNLGAKVTISGKKNDQRDRSTFVV